MKRLAVVSILVLAGAAATSRSGSTQLRITTPKEAFGFNFGDDYQLANYTRLSSYWRTLDKESDRLVLHDMGQTAENRTQLMAIVTSPENHGRLARYKEISQRLARAEGLSEEAARALAAEGKAIVWIDGGLHATETLGAQQLGEMVYQMVSRTDDETRRFLNDTVVLFVHANPDGNELVADWYMRNPAPEERTLSALPRLYQKYIGHDNNRDFFASTQPETENINRALYHEWMPQVLYNHHQSGPAGTVLWSSPQRDPYNYNLDALLILGLQALGTHMHQRLAAEGKPGATMASGGPYDGWWNGGIRNTGNFHNILAVLTETIGGPTPMRIPLVIARQLPSRDQPNPIAPQAWHFRQSVEYSISLNRAVVDYASRNREHLLFNIYRMGRNAIDRGSRDTWTPSPTRFQALAERLAEKTGAEDAGGRGAVDPSHEAGLWAELRKPALRDPRGYIIPSDQPDFPTATKFVNALREVNVGVQRAAREFTVQGKQYPRGSYVVMTAQAFRPHVIDMFEPQDHPNVFPFPGGPPTPPYDNAGWTLAFQMGVQFDRILEPFTGPFENITDWNIKPPAGRVDPVKGGVAYVLRPDSTNAFVAVNRVLKAKQPVWHAAQTFRFRTADESTRLLRTIASDLGVSFRGEAGLAAPGDPVRLGRIGLWDQYGGSMESGWTRWILEQFEFPFTRVYAPELDAGNLSAKYDVLIFVNGAISSGQGGGRGGRGGGAPNPADIHAEYRSQLGRVTAQATVPQLRRFVEDGGTVVAIGDSAMNLATFLELPVDPHLVENGAPLPRSKYFVPGSLLTARVDVKHPLAAGIRERTDFFFDNSPVFKIRTGASGVTPIAWFDSATPLHSGWAWGQKYLEGGVIAVEARLGKGRVVLYGPEILQRAQPHGTFKLLFNALYRSP